MKDTQRTVWLDWLRVTACFMVMVVHCTEPYYLGGEGSRILTESDAWCSGLFDSFVRACVPLFVVASSYLLFPLKQCTGQFFRRRVTRVLVPFLIWTVVYALVWGEPAENFRGLLLNFNYAAGHLWFVYMILGVYLIMPLLSPWAEKVGKRELRLFLGIWFFTSIIPILRTMMDSNPPVIYGPTGLPNTAKFPLWGEASWNNYGTFYYISGFLGYLLLGLYFKRFVGELSWKKTLAIALPCFMAGFTITFGGFMYYVFRSCSGGFPVEGPAFAYTWETTWMYDGIGVMLMTVGWILLFRKINACGRFYRKIVLPVSKASYGMYLGHMLVLAQFSGLFKGILPTPVAIPVAAVCTFVCVAAAALLLQRIPKVGKYIIG